MAPCQALHPSPTTDSLGSHLHCPCPRNTGWNRGSIRPVHPTRWRQGEETDRPKEDFLTSLRLERHQSPRSGFQLKAGTTSTGTAVDFHPPLPPHPPVKATNKKTCPLITAKFWHF